MGDKGGQRQQIRALPGQRRGLLPLGAALGNALLEIDRMPEKEQKIVFVRMREFERNITCTLEHIKKLAEA